MTAMDEPLSSGDRWRRLKRRLFPRGLSFTREGKIYVLVTLGVGFAAVNTANNLLFMVLGLMLGVIVVSGILSEVALRYIKIERHLPSEIRAGRPFPAELSLTNNKKRAASYSIELRDEIDGRPFRRRCYFLKVSAGETRSISYKCELETRGRVTFNGVIVSTRFPFGLFEKSRFVPLLEEAVVFPKTIDVALPFAASEFGTGSLTVNVKGSGQDFRDLREMAPGDDPRRIHWPASAKTGRLFIRENDAEASSLVEIVLDAAAAGADEEQLEEAEQNISLAASLAERYLDLGSPVRLVTGLEDMLHARDRKQLPGLLTHLALLDVKEAAAREVPHPSYSHSVLIGPRLGGGGVTAAAARAR